MLKIQQGMDMLHGEAPGLVSSVGLPNLSVPTTLPMFMPTPPTVATGGIPVGHPDVVSNVMSQMIQQMASGRINQPPEERFRDQLDQLSAMGFADHQTNLSVLVRTFGDVASAVELLQQP
jgi:ubiquilin